MLPLPLGAANPQISVVLPTFNRAAFLERATASVLAQTFHDFELLIVDDGSSDGTFSVAEKFVARHPNVRYLRHANRKLGFSRNVGIQASVGSLVAFLDSDDEYKPEYLASRQEFLADHPEVALVQGGFHVNGNPEVVDYFDPTRRVSIYDCVVGPTFFGRRELFFELGGFHDIAYGEDTDFWARASKKARTVTLQEPILYLKHETAGSIIASALQNQRG
jgi:glycosyltransferase involved in cell wall biosynthesis